MSTLWETMLQTIAREYKDAPNSFLRKNMISKTVHPNCDAIAKNYHNEMKEDPFFAEHILPNLNDSNVGTPYQFAPLPGCSPVTVTHAYQLYLLKKYVDVFVPQEKISHVVEIGGGYGHTCRMIMNLGYKGRYSIIDFPQMLNIQKDFLMKNAINNVDFQPLDMEKVQPKENEISILFASFSVNEMPIEQRLYIEPYYNQYDYLFFAHNRAFDGVNNVEYFDELTTKLSANFNVEYFNDPHRGQKSWFMICSKKENTNASAAN